MIFSFKARLYIGFTLAILLSGASGLTSYVIFQKQAAQRVWMKRTRGVVDSAKNIQNMMIDMETGRRAFRATNQIRFLAPYTSASLHIAAGISGLRELLTDNPTQENMAIVLEKHIDALINFWESSNNNGAIYDRDVITKLTDEEKLQMDQIRHILADLQADENMLLAKRREENEALIHDATLSTTIYSIVSGAIILILVYFIFREFTKRTKIQGLLKNSIAQLRSQAVTLQTSEKNLQSTLNELEEINKQLGKFVYTVAHDVKSPITGISGVLFLLEKNELIASDPALSEYLNLSSAAALYLCKKVDSLLEYAQQSSNQQVVEQVDIKELLEQIITLMFAPKNIHIQVGVIMPVLRTKKLKIEQVFQNLISNAIKYNDKENGLIEIGCTDKNAYYEFYVRDNGQGISEEDTYTIFDLFDTGSSRAKGETSTGFGLNITKLIVEEHGGKIWVESIPGAGSIFYFDWKK